MEERPQNKLKLLEIQDLLLRETDDEHHLTVQEIIDYLAAKGMKSERKSIYLYMELLEAYGMDIINDKEKQNRYHVGNRLFQLAELKLLVDAVKFAKFITAEKSSELITKLKSLTSVHEAERLERNDWIYNRLKSKNNAVYLNVDAIHEAILKQRMICFKYFDYDLDKEIVYRKQGEFYRAIPVFLCWDDEKYYVIVYQENHQDYAVYRLDKMREVSMLKTKHEHIADLEAVEQYCAGLFHMYTGNQEEVTMSFHPALVNVVFDRFGLDVEIQKQNDGWFTITEKITVSPTFFAWVLQFGDKAKILSPSNVKNELIELCQKSLNQYE